MSCSPRLILPLSSWEDLPATLIDNQVPHYQMVLHQPVILKPCPPHLNAIALSLTKASSNFTHYWQNISISLNFYRHQLPSQFHIWISPPTDSKYILYYFCKLLWKQQDVHYIKSIIGALLRKQQDVHHMQSIIVALLRKQQDVHHMKTIIVALLRKQQDVYYMKSIIIVANFYESSRLNTTAKATFSKLRKWHLWSMFNTWRYTYIITC